MSDRETLIRAMLDSPADPGPRKILADWLDEYDPVGQVKGDERIHGSGCLRRPGHWLLIAYPGKPQQIHWMAEDRKGMTGADVKELGAVPGTPIRCSYQPDIPAHHITGETTSYKGQPCGALAMKEWQGRWLCDGHFHTVTNPRPAPKPKPATPAQQPSSIAWLYAGEEDDDERA